ncbi:hypothetical protein T484DRAFT_1887647 [Baffinella frigidus]|nr:hypothetical protein T484DRAFT_1887647 [Cryptophyta sp. CCMP2293]
MAWGEATHRRRMMGWGDKGGGTENVPQILTHAVGAQEDWVMLQAPLGRDAAGKEEHEEVEGEEEEWGMLRAPLERDAAGTEGQDEVEGEEVSVAEHCAVSLRGIAAASPEGRKAVVQHGGTATLSRAAAAAQAAQAAGEKSGSLLKACMLALEVLTGGTLEAIAVMKQAGGTNNASLSEAPGRGKMDPLVAHKCKTRIDAANTHEVEGARLILVSHLLPD